MSQFHNLLRRLARRLLPSSAPFPKMQRETEKTGADGENGALSMNGAVELYRVEPYSGLVFRVRREDFSIVEEVFYQRRYAAYFPFGHPGAVVLDAGAHLGCFSVFAARNLGPGSRIIAYEPVPENHALCQGNLRLNQCENVLCVCAGVWSQTGSIPLRLNPRNPAGHSMFSRKVERESAAGEREGGGEISVDVISLADAFERHRIETCDFLKMDCEGAEYDIFYAAPLEILRRIRTISLEFHDVEGERHTGLDLLRFLVDAGFSIAAFDYSPTRLDLNFGRLIATREPLLPKSS